MVSALVPSWPGQIQSYGDSRRAFSRIEQVLEMPDLKRVQLASFEWFYTEGLRELFQEISPIVDFTGKNLELHFLDYEFDEPKYSEAECRERDMTFSRPLKVQVRLVAKETGELKEQWIFMGDFPWMTPRGTFVVNGAERVVVSQLVRSPGVYFTLETEPISGRQLCFAKLIPNRGAWLEFETSTKDVMSVKVDRKRKIPVTTLMRAIGYGSDDDLLEMFGHLEAGERSFLRETIAKDPTKNVEDALLEFYRRLRPGDPPTVENSRSLLNSLFFNARRYDLGKVGRYRMNKRLGLEVPIAQRTLTKDDLTKIVATMIALNNGDGNPDDIDHLGNRRVRSVGELIQNQFRIGLLRMERVIKERMSIQDPEAATPAGLLNIRPVVAAMKEFFGGSQLSQFMDQTNPLAELTHKRRLSALGPGGLNRDRAGMDVRDVHHSHYGRVCPIETPEGPNIGLIGSLATFARINEYGFIETPYRRVDTALENSNQERLIGRTLAQPVVNTETGEFVAEAGQTITAELAAKIAELPARLVRIRPYVSNDIKYLSADEEDRYYIAQANSPLNENNELVSEQVEARHRQQFILTTANRINYMDVSPKQVFSVATALIPFLEHDDANRALMGANMQRQAVPLIRPESPIVGTGMELQAARDSGQVVLSEVEGTVTRVTARSIIVTDSEGKEHDHPLSKYMRTNQGTAFTQRPIVNVGDEVRRLDTLADSYSTQGGELALGQNVVVAFMSFDGYNFEDAIILSQRVVQEDKFTSVHIEKHEVEARDTKLGPEEITRDIPNVGEDTLKDLDELGIIRVGAEVRAGDILVGKITPKGETELTAEERLLRAIFGEKAREVKDTSLRVPHGESGKVVDVKILSRENGDELPAGVNQLVRVAVAQKRKISEGDKMAGRHGNKGVISRILPVEDMPFLPDGTPVDIILNPIGVPSRMNVGQILETHLGAAGQVLGEKYATAVFDGAKEYAIEDLLARAWLVGRALQDNLGKTQVDGSREHNIAMVRAWVEEKGYDYDALFEGAFTGAAKKACLRLWLDEHGVTETVSDDELDTFATEYAADHALALPISGKVNLRDGRTGQEFSQPVTVGNIYMLKLVHLVEDKVHARSTGPYSLITQQPLGGKAQFGGQRFGEMEVWALEAYGASHVLQEILTVKSDDVVGRVKTYEAIVKGDPILEPGVPESFKVLVKELQSLGLSMEVLNEDEEHVQLAEDIFGTEEGVDLGINLTGFEEG